jgi:hypothetical protein
MEAEKPQLPIYKGPIQQDQLQDLYCNLKALKKIMRIQYEFQFYK